MQHLSFFVVLIIGFACQAKNEDVDYRTVPIYVNSIPKCGTHLLTKCISLLTGRSLNELAGDYVTPDMLPKARNHEFFVTHVKYSSKAASVFRKHGYKTFFIIRDPRDKIVSQVYWIFKGGWEGQMLNSPLRQMPFDQVLAKCIEVVQKEYNLYLPWLGDSRCCVVKFEELVGPRGGGTRKKQIHAIKKIAEHIHVPLTDELLEYCLAHLFGNSVTFREGKTGGWQTHFKPEHKALFKTVAPRLLRDLGYEKNENW